MPVIQRRPSHMPDMSIIEAARELGYSADTVRRGITRGTGPLGAVLKDAGRRGNDGRWIVSLTPAEINRHRKQPDPIGQPMPPQTSLANADTESETASLMLEVAALKANLSAASALSDERREQITDLRKRLDAAEAERQRLVATIERISESWWRRLLR